jgi:hypothetical protein
MKATTHRGNKLSSGSIIIMTSGKSDIFPLSLSPLLYSHSAICITSKVQQEVNGEDERISTPKDFVSTLIE